MAITVAPPSDAYIRLFSNRHADIPVLVWTAAPSPGEVPKPPVLRTELVQLSASLGTSVGGEIEQTLAETESDSATGQASGWRRIDIAVSLPAVDRQTTFELLLRVPSTSGEGWCPAGRLRLRLYPEDPLHEVRSWAASHRLSVDDPKGMLARFLRSQDIPFGGPDPYPRQGPFSREAAGGVAFVTLYTDPKVDARSVLSRLVGGGAAVVFREQQRGLPVMTTHRQDDRLLIEVETPLVGLLAEEPQAQLTFVEIFRLIADRYPFERGR